MARPNIIVALYPDVPFVRGVPQMRRSPTAAQIRALAIATSAISGRLWQAAQSQPKWGVYPAGYQPSSTRTLREIIVGTRRDDNTPNGRVIVPDSVLAFDNRNEARVSDFPVQQGAFASYNKVAVPYELVVRLSKGGSLEDRAVFLQQVASVAASLALYDVRTPERTYLGVNVTRYEVTRRGSKGAYFLTEVDLYFREIRQVAAQYSTTEAATRNAEQPAARPAVNQGIVQPEPVPSNLSEDGF